MFRLLLVYYRPQTKFAKVMFLHLSVSHSVHGGGCMAGGVCVMGGMRGRGACMPPPADTTATAYG